MNPWEKEKLSPEQRADALVDAMGGHRAAIASAIRAAVRAEREACAAIAETHPLAPDTTTGTRQRWLREAIAGAIRRGESVSNADELEGTVEYMEAQMQNQYDAGDNHMAYLEEQLTYIEEACNDAGSPTDSLPTVKSIAPAARVEWMADRLKEATARAEKAEQLRDEASKQAIEGARLKGALHEALDRAGVPSAESYQQHAPSRALPLEERLSLLTARAEKAEEERDALQTFKDYCHERMDAAGIHRDPESPHRRAGCRIGGRFDMLVRERNEAGFRAEKAEARVRELEGVLRPMAEEARMWADEAPGDRPLFHRHTTPSAISLDDCRRASAALTPEAPDA